MWTIRLVSGSSGTQRSTQLTSSNVESPGSPVTCPPILLASAIAGPILFSARILFTTACFAAGSPRIVPLYLPWSLRAARCAEAPLPRIG